MIKKTNHSKVCVNMKKGHNTFCEARNLKNGDLLLNGKVVSEILNTDDIYSVIDAINETYIYFSNNDFIVTDYRKNILNHTIFLLAK